MRYTPRLHTLLFCFALAMATASHLAVAHGCGGDDGGSCNDNSGSSSNSNGGGSTGNGGGQAAAPSNPAGDAYLACVREKCGPNPTTLCQSNCALAMGGEAPQGDFSAEGSTADIGIGVNKGGSPPDVTYYDENVGR